MTLVSAPVTRVVETEISAPVIELAIGGHGGGTRGSSSTLMTLAPGGWGMTNSPADRATL
jgi:hypothetical protein